MHWWLNLGSGQEIPRPAGENAGRAKDFEVRWLTGIIE
jgi:hypothetical protein